MPEPARAAPAYCKRVFRQLGFRDDEIEPALPLGAGGLFAMFIEKTVTAFLDALASKEAVPGGGSSAALGGAQAAALVSMVCNLTLGKKGYEGVQEAIRDLLAQSEALRCELPHLLEADTQVYGQVMAAYRLPQKSSEQKQAREVALQAALKEAAEVPLTIAARCARVVELALSAAQMGNTWAVSDAGVGALLAEACMHAALLNVAINLASIHDAAYVAQAQERIACITTGKSAIKEQVMAIVRGRMGAT
jgi:formiminotetrahydrofolate cyclodeaminase